jgi:hypothetical protein
MHSVLLEDAEKEADYFYLLIKYIKFPKAKYYTLTLHHSWAVKI